MGAAISIQHMLEFAERVIKKLKLEESHGLEALVYHGQFVAGLQVRSAGSVAGNIFITRDHVSRGTPFPSDLFTVLSTLGTKVTISSNEYENSYKQFDLIEMPATEILPDDAVIVRFDIPFTSKS